MNNIRRIERRRGVERGVVSVLQGSERCEFMMKIGGRGVS